MKKIIPIFLAVSCLLCAGCGDKKQNDGSDTKNGGASLDYVIDDISGITYMDNGVIYFDDYRLNFFDAESGLSTAICSDPSCKHEKPEHDEKSDCTAVIAEGMNVNSLAYIGDRFYFSYGESEEAFTEKTFFTADADGSNRRELAKVEAQEIKNTVYTDSCIFVSYTNSFDMSDEASVYLNELAEWESGVYRIDLASGETEKVCKHKGERGNISKMSSDGENVYYLFEYKDETAYRAELYRYNIKSKKEEKIKDFENCFFNGGFSGTALLYTQQTDGGNSLHNYTFDGKDSTVAQDGDITNYYYFDDRRIVYCVYEADSARYCLYDTQTGQTENASGSSSEMPIIYAVVGDKIYLSRSEADSVSYGIGYLSKSDFLNGDFDKIVKVK